MKKKRTVVVAGLILLISLIISIPFAIQAYADGMATDTLEIKIGYWGMEQDDFVSKGSYRWNELDDQFGGALQTHKVAYSFFRQSEDGDYMTVIDSARGFYISSLIDYIGIDDSDINSIAFYTKDKSVGYFTSFTYNELFATQRYYFEDLASYLSLEKDDTGKITGISIDDGAWSNKTRVQPMLALEDSWVKYEIEQEHTAPNYSSLGTGNRFRLLFGQTSPTESRTNQTAKYVHTLYITLKGTPKVVKEPDNLSGEIGQHTTTIQVSTQDVAMINSLLKSMKWNSTNEDVLTIDGVTMSQSTEYDDVVNVEISYSVHKEGTASITGSYAGISVGGSALNVTGTKGNGSENQEGNGEGTAQESEDAKGEDGKGKDETNSNGKGSNEVGKDETDSNGKGSNEIGKDETAAPSNGKGTEAGNNQESQKKSSESKAEGGNSGGGSGIETKANAEETKANVEESKVNEAESKENEAESKKEEENLKEEVNKIYELDEKTVLLLSEESQDISEKIEDKDPLEIKEDTFEHIPLLIFSGILLLLIGMIGEKIRFKNKI